MSSEPPILDSAPGFDAMSRPPVSSGKAVASLVLGLVAPLLLFLTAIPAIVLGLLSLREIKRSDGRIRGRGMAIAGIVLGAGGVVLSTILILNALLDPHFFVSNSARRMMEMNRLHVVALALQNHAWKADAEVLPAQFLVSRDGKPLLSWRVLILPHVEQAALFNRFKRDEPWNSPHNRQLISRMPDVFRVPNDLDNDGTKTSIVAVTGPNTMWPGSRGRRFREVSDGMTETILLVALADTGIPWTEPRDLTIAQLKAIYQRAEDGGPRLTSVRGLACVLADTSVHVLPADTPWEKIEALLTCDGGEAVEIPP